MTSTGSSTRRSRSSFTYLEFADEALGFTVPPTDAALKSQRDALAAVFGLESASGKLKEAIETARSGFSTLWKAVNDAVNAFSSLRNQQQLGSALGKGGLDAGASFKSILRLVNSTAMPDGVIELAKTGARRGDRVYATLCLLKDTQRSSGNQGAGSTPETAGKPEQLAEEPFSFTVVTRGIYNTVVADVGYVEQVDAPSDGSATGHLSAGMAFMFHHHADGSSGFERFMNSFDPSVGFGARLLNFTRQRGQGTDSSFETDPGLGAEARIGVLGDTISGVFGYEIGEETYWGIAVAPFAAWDFVSDAFWQPSVRGMGGATMSGFDGSVQSTRGSWIEGQWR